MALRMSSVTMILPLVSTLARAMAARGSCGICTSSSACTALASSQLSVTSTGLASLSCSAWLRRSAATHAGVIELFGLFGVEKAGFDWLKLLGTALFLAGIIIFKKN